MCLITYCVDRARFQPGPRWGSSFLVSPHHPLQRPDQRLECPTHTPHIMMSFSFFSSPADTKIEMAVGIGIST